MLSTRELVLIAISIVLLLVIVYVVYRGCACMREGFEGEEAANADIPALEMSREEVALFEDLKSEKYSAQEIDRMVAEGVIDQKLVEKFLTRLDAVESTKPVAAKPVAAKPAAKKVAAK